MKWFIVVLMLGVNTDGTRDTFVYTQPKFDTADACQEYVYINSGQMGRAMMQEFQGKQIENVYCIQKDKLERLFELELDIKSGTHI